MQWFDYALFWIEVTYIKRSVETDKKGVEDIELQKPVLCDPETEEALRTIRRFGKL